MKKNYLLILIFLLLGGGTAWYLLNKNTGEKSTLGWDRNFKVENEDEIHKIFIAKRSGETTTLERQGSHWTYNGQYKARPNAMHNVLEAITKLELQSVPPKAALDGIVKELAARGIKVEIYNKAGKKIKSYYVGGVTPDARGTYMILEDAEQPMVMHLPLMEGQIRARYDFSGDEWRDRSVFGYEPEDIKAVSVEYPLQKSKSFRLKKSGAGYEVTPFYENTPTVNRPLEKGSAEAFLTGFNSLVAENFINNSTIKDSILQTIPFTIISVTDTKGDEKIAALYTAYRINTASGDRTADIIERYYASLNTGDFMLVQHRVFQKIFWAYESFFQKAPVKVKD